MPSVEGTPSTGRDTPVGRGLGPTGTAVAAAGLLILTSALFPRVDDPTDPDRFLAVLADTAARTRFVLLAVPLGVWALAVAAGALERRLTNGADAAWLRVSVHALLVAAAVATVQFGLAHAALSERLTGTSDGTVLWAGATYIRWFSLILLAVGTLTMGVGLLCVPVIPRWLAGPIVPVTVALLVVSVVGILGGLTFALQVASGGLAALTAIWLVAVGLTLGRG